MITYSDNDSAGAIYSRVGDAGLHEVAASAGMTNFAVAGYWASAQVTAADMARLFSRLHAVVGGPHRRSAGRLLGSIVEEQRWGIPKAAGRRWTVRFKGGWRQTGLGFLVHQAARLSDGALHLSPVVLTDAQPSHERAVQVVQGVAERLLARSRCDRDHKFFTGGKRARN